MKSCFHVQSTENNQFLPVFRTITKLTKKQHTNTFSKFQKQECFGAEKEKMIKIKQKTSPKNILPIIFF